MLIQFEEEICFGYTGSEWIKEKLNTFEISIFFRLVLYKKETVMQCLGEKDGFLVILVLAWS